MSRILLPGRDGCWQRGGCEACKGEGEVLLEVRSDRPLRLPCPDCYGAIMNEPA